MAGGINKIQYIIMILENTYALVMYGLPELQGIGGDGSAEGAAKKAEIMHDTDPLRGLGSQITESHG